MPMSRAFVPALLAALLAGCSGSDSGHTQPEVQGASSAGAQASASDGARSGAGRGGAISPGPVGAVQDVSGVGCVRTGDTWGFEGVVRNPDAVDRDYVVMVSIVKTSGGSLVRTTEVPVRVPAGQQRRVAAPRFFRARGSGLTCIVSATKSPVRDGAGGYGPTAAGPG